MQAELVQAQAAAESAAQTPLLSGPAMFLWTFFGAVLLIMLIVFYLLLRGRAGSRRVREEKPAPTTDFFQPAGEGAEISFEEDDLAAAARARGDLAAEAAPSVVIKKAEPAAEKPEAARRGSPFAGLFAKKQKPAEDPAPFALGDEPINEDDFAEVKIERGGGPITPPVADSRAETEAMREAERLDADRQRMLADMRQREEDEARRRAEDAALASLRAREAEAREAARLAERRAAVAADPVYHTLSGVEEALAAQSEAIRAETRNLLDAFSRKIESRLDAAALAAPPRAAMIGESGDADLLSRRFAEHRDSVNAALGALAQKVTTFSGGEETTALRAEIASLRSMLGDRALGAAAPAVQLADIVRNALPPSAYEFGASLANGRRADCVVRLPQPPGPIAIDAKFPAEAFDALRRAPETARDTAEQEFRRIALRHIVDIAERLIVPDQTADSALMFVPSEATYSELHARFPDVVQDSYRARVWIVSPTTLMATLHTIRAVLRDAQQRESASFIHSEAQHVLAEVERLRARVAALETNFDRVRNDVRDLVSTTDQVYRRAESITNTGRALAEESFDRGARRIISAEAEPAPNGEATRAPLPAPPVERAPTGAPLFPLR